MHPVSQPVKWPPADSTVMQLGPNTACWRSSWAPWREGRMRPQKKPTTYQHLVQQCRDAEWQTCSFPVQVGFPAQSMLELPPALRTARRKRGTAGRRLGRQPRASCWLWSRRADGAGRRWLVTGQNYRPANWRVVCDG